MQPSGFRASYERNDWRDITVKTVLIAALGATLAASAGSAFAGDRDGRWGGQAPTRYDRNCGCNLPVVTTPFYTVRPAAPPIYVRAPGMRVSAPPVYAPGPVVYVQSPTIYVDAPPVQVAPAQVYLEAPSVNVRPSEVSVAPPEIHFTPADPNRPAEDCCNAAPQPRPMVVAPRQPTHNYRQEPGERG